MRKRRFLAAILLSVVLCFVVSGVGYGEIDERMVEGKALEIDFRLLEALVKYIMYNSENHLNVGFLYDQYGFLKKLNEVTRDKDIETKGKIYISIRINKDIFHKFGTEMYLTFFSIQLDTLYSYIQHIATDLNTDIVAVFYGEKEGSFGHEFVPLAYFYDGEYH